jgi:hypothetical protein
MSGLRRKNDGGDFERLDIGGEKLWL